jgi:hypothetical protein
MSTLVRSAEEQIRAGARRPVATSRPLPTRAQTDLTARLDAAAGELVKAHDALLLLANLDRITRVDTDRYVLAEQAYLLAVDQWRRMRQACAGEVSGT